MRFIPFLFGRGELDERFINHRYRSTRAGLVAGLLAMFAWFNYDYLANGTLRWDYLVILVAMAVVKVATMIYLQRKE